MTLEIKNQIKKRQKLFHSSKKDEWKQTCSEIKKEIRKRKKDYFQKKYVLGNPNWWKEVNKNRTEQKATVFEKELCESLNEGFYKIWNGAKQQDLTRFLKKKQK